MNSHDPRRSPPILSGCFSRWPSPHARARSAEFSGQTGGGPVPQGTGGGGAPAGPGGMPGTQGPAVERGPARASTSSGRGSGGRRRARHEASDLPRIRSHDDPAARRHDVARVRTQRLVARRSRLTLGSFRRTASPAITWSNTTRRRRRSSTGRSRPAAGQKTGKFVLPTGCTAPTAAQETSCATKFVTAFGLQAYRRPVAATSRRT